MRCNQSAFQGSSRAAVFCFPLLLHFPFSSFWLEKKGNLFIAPKSLRAIHSKISMELFSFKNECSSGVLFSIFVFISVPSLLLLSCPPSLPSLRCSSKKQPVLSALCATQPNMDSTAPGSSGAFSFLVRPLCHPHCHGGSRQSSAPSFPLTVCLLWPYPSQRARGLPKGVESAS